MSIGQRHAQSQFDQLLILGGCHGPAYHQTREQIQDHRQVQPAFCRFDRFGIGDPLLVGQARRELPVEMIGSKARRRIAGSGRLAPLLRLC